MQPQTQTAQYWEEQFKIEQTDIDQIYNHLLEVERPQRTDQLARVIIQHRVAAETRQAERQMAGRAVYQPSQVYEVGDKLVFPAMAYQHGEVTSTRPGFNPEVGTFDVLQAKIDGKQREFAMNLEADHVLSAESGDLVAQLTAVDVDELVDAYGRHVAAVISDELNSRDEFIRLGGEWFVRALMAEVNVGHLHLAEAVLDMFGGGPLPTEEILPHLDMDSSLHESVLRFSLNYALLKDARFDEIAPKNQVAWFLHRMEPDEVKTPPERLQYESIPYDRALLSPQLLALERELDDEWSDLPASESVQPVVFTLLFPHRLAGTMPLSSRIRPLFPPSSSPRQRMILVDEFTEEEIVVWVVREGRYVYGLADWYAENGIPIGGFVHLKPSEEPGKVILGYDKRRAQREWVRLATAVDNRIQFDLQKRAIGCGFDDQLIVGTDVTAAIDALWRRAESHRRSLASIIAELFDTLSPLTPQNTVHAKTLYSAINMLRRMPPAPLFAELVRHPAFVSVGDNYWQIDRNKWRESN